MKKKISIFQIILLIFFGVTGLFGFIAFTNYSPSGNTETENLGQMQIWGTLDEDIFNEGLSFLKNLDEGYSKVSYVQKSEESFNQEFLEAVAEGNIPDLILVSNSTIFNNINKIYKIPTSSISESVFFGTFLESFSPFFEEDGSLAIPFLADPIVMYYNKDLFFSAGIPIPPQEWKDFLEMAPKINKIDENKNIIKSIVAFGDGDNVENLKEILATLFFQSGNPIIKKENGIYKSTLYENSSFQTPYDALDFFSSFSNPNAPQYSWNTAMPNSKDFFIGGSLGVYFGYASEISDIRLKNPNLNFDVTEIPRTSSDLRNNVMLKTFAFAIPKSAKNIENSSILAFRIANKDILEKIEEKTQLPPVRKEMVANLKGDKYLDIFYKEAIYGSSFMDPDEEKTDKIFSDLVNNYISGRFSAKESFSSASRSIDLLLLGK